MLCVHRLHNSWLKGAFLSTLRSSFDDSRWPVRNSASFKMEYASDANFRKIYPTFLVKMNSWLCSVVVITLDSELSY